MAINKVVYNGETLVDLTGDTVVPSKVAKGVTFHDASGELRTGQMSEGGSGYGITYINEDGSMTESDLLNLQNGLYYLQNPIEMHIRYEIDELEDLYNVGGLLSVYSDELVDIISYDTGMYFSRDVRYDDEWRAGANDGCGWKEYAAIGNAFEYLEKKHFVLSKTLIAGQTTLQFTDESIADDALVYVYTNKWGVNPTNVVQNGNTLTITFEAQNADLGVKIEVRNDGVF